MKPRKFCSAFSTNKPTYKGSCHIIFCSQFRLLCTSLIFFKYQFCFIIAYFSVQPGFLTRFFRIIIMSSFPAVIIIFSLCHPFEILYCVISRIKILVVHSRQIVWI